MFTTQADDHQGAVLKNAPQNLVTVVLFTRGWSVYEDLAILIGSAQAQLALQRCIDYCTYNLQHYTAQLAKIARLGDLNPDDRDGIGENIMSLGAEVFFCMHENRLFEIGTVRELPYQFYHIGPHRLYLQRVK